MVYQNPWLPDVRISYSEVARMSSDFGLPKDPAILLANQILGADSSTGVGAMANAQPQAQFVAPQGYVCTLVPPRHVSL
jgi:hypothetical protein